MQSLGRRVAAASPLLDGLCLAVFALLGRESHGIDSGAGWYLAVTWPFVAGWFAAALTLSLYTAASRLWLRLSATWIIGVAAALILRVAVTHRAAPLAFILVAYGFVGIAVCAWRIAAFALARLTRRTAPPR